MIFRQTCVQGILALALGGLMLFAISTKASAADITCVQFPSIPVGGFPAERRASMLENWPSGRLPDSATCLRGLIKGKIETGDSANFSQFLHQNHPFLEMVYLWSPGGSVEEAMKIGRLIRKGLIRTEAPVAEFNNPAHGVLGRNDITLGRSVCNNTKNCHCASACFLIWAAGVDRSGDLLGLHRPTIQSTSFANLPPDRASVLYRQLLLEIGTYLGEMEIPRRFTEIMTDTSSANMTWLNESEAQSIAKPPSIAEWIASSCGEITKAELSAFSKLAESDEAATAPEKALVHRYYETGTCGLKKIRAARDAITEVK